jgi:aconitate hydratase
MFRDYDDASTDPIYTKVHELDLNTVVPSMSGPKRPHDRVSVTAMPLDFKQCLASPVGFKGFNIASDKMGTGN